MEGTSGAADPMTLRGAMGEAALNPGRQAARAVCFADRAGPMDQAARASAWRGSGRSRDPAVSAAGGHGRPARAGRSGGIASPRSHDTIARSWSRAAESRPARPGARGSPPGHSGAGFPAGTAAIARQEVSGSFESGRSSHRRTSTSLAFVRRREALTGFAGRGWEEAGGESPPSPCSEKLGWRPARAHLSFADRACERKLLRRGRASEDETLTGRHLDTEVDEADGAPTPSGACSQPGASRGRRVGEAGRRSDGTWLCSRAVLVAEVDGKRRARSSPFEERGRSSPPGRPGGRKRRSKPARGGKAPSTVADPRGSHAFSERSEKERRRELPAGGSRRAAGAERQEPGVGRALVWRRGYSSAEGVLVPTSRGL